MNILDLVEKGLLEGGNDDALVFSSGDTGHEIVDSSVAAAEADNFDRLVDSLINGENNNGNRSRDSVLASIPSSHN